MKKGLLFFIIVFLIAIIWFGESRSFYCLGNGNCVTIWKTYNNRSYIIPGRYYGLFRPSDQYIQSSNTNEIIIFFSEELPAAFVFHSSEDVKVYNGKKTQFTFYDYTTDTTRFNKIFYPPDALKFTDLKKDAGIMFVNIHENYAEDRSGKNL